MTDNTPASQKSIWEGTIKSNMVPLKVRDGQSNYVLDPKRNCALEIHFDSRCFISPSELSKTEPAVGGRSDVLDISNAEFLILNRNPALNTYQQYIPWKRILQIVFVDA